MHKQLPVGRGAGRGVRPIQQANHHTNRRAGASTERGVPTGHVTVRSANDAPECPGNPSETGTCKRRRPCWPGLAAELSHCEPDGSPAKRADPGPERRGRAPGPPEGNATRLWRGSRFGAMTGIASAVTPR